MMQQNYLFRFKLGFTILEMLLVIALIGILATTGISYYQHRTEEVKISRAVLQIQQIFQAANAFYLTYKCWPTGYQNQNPTCPNQVLPFQAFVPVGSQMSPWGSENKIGLANGGNNPRKFTVTVSLPANVGTQIANQLPTAIYNRGSVFAEISIPSQQSTLPFIVKIIKTIALQDGQSLPVPGFTCPAGWRGQIATFISGIHIAPTINAEQGCNWGGLYTPAPYALLSMPLSLLHSFGFCIPDANVPNKFNCSIFLNIRGRQRHNTAECYNFSDDSNGTADITYLGYCAPLS